MRDALYLRKSTAPWDHAWRLAAAAAIGLGLPLLVRNGHAVVAGGVVAGFWLVAGLTGY